jgi:hypothetical protein
LTKGVESCLKKGMKLFLYDMETYFSNNGSKGVSNGLVNLSPYLGTPAQPSTPEVLRARERVPTPPFVIFTFGLVIESIKEFGGASMLDPLFAQT